MAKETATYISQLVATNPVASDSVSVGDDHLRMLKTVLKTQFSGLTGTTAIASSEAELNILDGVTATAAELNYLDITTLGTSADSKALTQASGVVTIAGDVVVSGTTPKVTIGDAGAEDTTLLFDGNAKDFYVALDDSADKLVIGEGSTVGTNSILTITDDTVTLGDGAAVDTAIVFDGNAKDFHIALDDSADKLIIGEGSTVGTNEILSITDDTVTIGDGAAVDTYLNFDGNAADFRIGIDDGTDKLEIGGGVAHGTAAGISMDINGDMTLGGGIVCSDEVLSGAQMKDYGETINAIGSITSGTNADCEDGNVQSVTFTANTFNFGLTNALGSNSSTITLIVTNGGLATVTWLSGAHGGGGAAVDWAGGSAPTLTNSGIDILTFTTINGGTQWYGFPSGIDLK
tara:strand:- start:71 stop:1282 length:1212 start_codon:yes stop_codon:yes gene_type:complete